MSLSIPAQAAHAFGAPAQHCALASRRRRWLGKVPPVRRLAMVQVAAGCFRRLWPGQLGGCASPRARIVFATIALLGLALSWPADSECCSRRPRRKMGI